MKRAKRLSHILIICCIVLTVLACGFPSLSGEDKPATQRGEPSPTVERTGGLVLNGAAVDQISSISEGETIGPIIGVQITNPTSGEVVATIPCGLVFNPGPGSDEQSLMVIQEISVEIPGGDTITIDAYVVCIDSSNSIPDSGSTYQVGEMVTGDLLKLANCLCGEELPADFYSSPTAFQDLFGIQVAVWSVADGISFDEVMDAMGSGEGAVSELEQILGPILGILESVSQEWLDRCDIQIQP